MTRPGPGPCCAPLLAAAERLDWVPAQAGGALVDGRAAASLGCPGPARTALAQAVRLAARHGLPHIERQARAALDGLD